MNSIGQQILAFPLHTLPPLKEDTPTLFPMIIGLPLSKPRQPRLPDAIRERLAGHSQLIGQRVSRRYRVRVKALLKPVTDQRHWIVEDRVSQ